MVQARAQAWPKNTYLHLSRMVDAVVLELASGNRCEVCKGTGMVEDMGCKECWCTGVESRLDRSRALAMGCDPSDYPKRWRGVYEWLLARTNEVGENNAKQFNRVLSFKEAA